MSKLLQALLSGMFFTFILDFFLFLGMKLHYIDLHEIDVYYNILFADHQNIFIFLFFTLFIGYIVIYINATKVKLITLSFLFLLSFSTLISPIGNSVAEFILLKKNQKLQNKKHTFIGDIYYDGRENVVFYDYDLEKMIILKKKELIQQ